MMNYGRWEYNQGVRNAEQEGDLDQGSLDAGWKKTEKNDTDHGYFQTSPGLT